MPILPPRQPVDDAGLALQPAVSIVTPYYNTGPIFAETVGSVFAQTLQQWEWIIVNDGSTDPAALAELEPLRASADSRIRVIDQANRGLPGARNAGVAAAQAPLLFFLDSDDLIEPTLLEKLAWLMHSDPRPAFATSWNIVFGAESLHWARGFETRDLFLFENTATSIAMVRRAVFDAVGGFDESLTSGREDYEFWLRCAAHGYWGRDIPEFLIRQRRKAPQHYQWYSWPVRDDPHQFSAFQRTMRARFPHLYRQGLPHLPPQAAPATLPNTLPFTNPLAPAGPRSLLLLLPRLDQPCRFALDLLVRLTGAGYYATVCATASGTHPLLEAFEQHADVFVLAHFLRPADYPRFLHYLTQSRHTSTVLIGQSELGYRLLPFLRAFCSGAALLDYVHPPERDQGRTKPLPGAEYHELLDLRLAGSSPLRERLVADGTPYERVAVLAANEPGLAHPAALIELARALRAELPRPAVSPSLARIVAALAIKADHELHPCVEPVGSTWPWWNTQHTAERRLARERLMLATYPLRAALYRYQVLLVRHPIWKVLGPIWRRLRYGNRPRSTIIK